MEMCTTCETFINDKLPCPSPAKEHKKQEIPVCKFGENTPRHSLIGFVELQAHVLQVAKSTKYS